MSQIPSPHSGHMIDAELFDRFLANETSLEEQALVQAWRSANPACERLFCVLETMPARPGVVPETAGQEPERAWAALAKRINPTQVEFSNAGFTKGRTFAQNSRRWYGAGVAAACAAVVGLVALFSGLGAFTRQPTQGAGTVYATQTGERLRVTLNDGTRVILAPASAITVTGRTVTLEGQALFTVTHDGAHPFVVKSGNTTTQVLGTVFGVQAYRGDAGTHVVVAEGRVAVNNTVLSNGDVATVSEMGVDLRHDAEYVSAWAAFAQGRLIIDAQTLADAAPQVGRWLGVEIEVHPTVRARRMSAVLGDQSVRDGLDLIAALTNTTYVQRGDTVSFRARN